MRKKVLHISLKRAPKIYICVLRHGLMLCSFFGLALEQFFPNVSTRCYFLQISLISFTLNPNLSFTSISYSRKVISP